MDGVPDRLETGLRKLTADNPQVRSILYPAYCFYQRKYITWKTWWICSRHYQAEIDPYRTLWIDPAEIEYMKDRQLADNRNLCYVKGGDWDQTRIRFENHRKVKFLRDHFVHDIPWEETEYYSEILDEIAEKGSYWHDCESEEEVKRRCEKLDGMYDHMEKQGYQTQRVLSAHPNWSGNCYPNEIIVNIGRHGEFIYETGKHRLTIAKILGLQRVAVQVMVRHQQWQALRDKVAVVEEINSLNEEEVDHLTHPDVEYLLTNSGIDPP